jgi:hypothetical protein
MRGLLLALAISLGGLTLAPQAEAACFGSGAFQNCYDSSGNSYTVQRYGNTTNVYGSNPNTGSTWNESVRKFGNTTYYNGTTNGRSWNMQQNNIGGTTLYNGTNSSGQPFSYVCTQYGGCN